jgi:hypothetical protein
MIMEFTVSMPTNKEFQREISKKYQLPRPPKRKIKEQGIVPLSYIVTPVLASTRSGNLYKKVKKITRFSERKENMTRKRCHGNAKNVNHEWRTYVLSNLHFCSTESTIKYGIDGDILLLPSNVPDHVSMPQ